MVCLVLHDDTPGARESAQIISGSLDAASIAILGPSVESLAAHAKESKVVVIVISCGADGSAQRSVRRLNTSLKPGCTLEALSFSLVTLGGARCSNSANQMREQIYSAGRKLAKKLVGAGANTVTMPARSTGTAFEIDAELVDVKASLEPFIESLKITHVAKLGQARPDGPINESPEPGDEPAEEEELEEKGEVNSNPAGSTAGGMDRAPESRDLGVVKRWLQCLVPDLWQRTSPAFVATMVTAFTAMALGGLTFILRRRHGQLK